MYPQSDSGTSALPPVAPRPCMHWPVEQNPGRTVAVFFFLLFVCFLLPWDTSKLAGFTRISEVRATSDFYQSTRESRTE